MPKEFRIPAGKAKYENWEMPDLTGVQRSINQRLEELENENVETVETVTEDSYNPPTLEELEQLRAEFEEEGRAEGLAKGLEEGRVAGFEEGKTQGFQEAYEAGYNEGLANAREVVEAEISKWQNLQEQIIEPLKVVDEDVELAIVELIKLIATGVLRRELNLSRGELRDIVKDAIDSLPNKDERVTLRVNPEDVQIVESACVKSLEDYKIIADESITKGGTILEMKNSLVNSTVERRYQALVDMIVGEAYPKSYLATKDLDNYALGSGSFSNKNALQELQKLQSELQSTDFKSLVHQSLNSEFEKKSSAQKQEFQAPVDFSESAPTQEFTPVQETQAPVGFSESAPTQEFTPVQEEQAPVGFSESAPTQEFTPAQEEQAPVGFSESTPTQEFTPAQEEQAPVDFSADELSLQKPKVELGKYRKPQAPVEFREDDDLVDLSLHQKSDEDSRVQAPEQKPVVQGKYRKAPVEFDEEAQQTQVSHNQQQETFAHQEPARGEDLEIDQATVSNWLDGEEDLSNLVAEDKKSRLNVMKFPGEKKKSELESGSSLVEGSYLEEEPEPKDTSLDDDLVDLSAFDDD